MMMAVLTGTPVQSGVRTGSDTELRRRGEMGAAVGGRRFAARMAKRSSLV